MDRSAGDKKKVLMDLLGLEALTSFRDVLRSGWGDAKRQADNARTTYQGEQRALETRCEGVPLLDAAERFRTSAGISSPITTEQELIDLELAATPPTKRVNHADLIANFDRYRDLKRAKEAAVQWNEAQRDTAAKAAAALLTLLRAGSTVLEEWSRDNCPLCEQPIAKDELSVQIAERLSELREAEERLRQLRDSLERGRKQLTELSNALSALKSNAPEGGWPQAAEIDEAVSAIDDAVRTFTTGLVNGSQCSDLEDIVLPSSADLKSAISSTGDEDRLVQSLSELIGLRDQFRRVAISVRRLSAAEQVQDAFATFLEITDARIQRELEDALSLLSDRVSIYYGLLRTSHLYSDVKLVYTTAREGGIEFQVEYDSRHPVTPPQRVMSESELNSLGLALFLARLKSGDQPWRFCVLDDVVNSFDADHRVGLAELLAREFADWQVLLLTHDRYFQSVCRGILNDWKFISIGAWSAAGGPVIASGKSGELLSERLAEGHAAAELGGLARLALEEGLSRPLEKLHLPIRYDPLGRYSGTDLLDALRGGLKRSTNPGFKDLAVLKRMAAESYVTNLGSHYKPTDPVPTSSDLLKLVNDLADLDRASTCQNCQTKMWQFENTSNGNHQCSCSTLKF